MRTLNATQAAILASVNKEISWLLKVDVGSTGSIDYYWSTKAKTWDGNNYTFKVVDFSPLPLLKGNPQENISPESKWDVRLSFKDSFIDANYASNFEGSTVTVLCVIKGYLTFTATYLDVDEFSVIGNQVSTFAIGKTLTANCGVDGIKDCIIDVSVYFEATNITKVYLTPGLSEELTTNLSTVTIYNEAEICSWAFKVKTSVAAYQEMRWQCAGFADEYLEGDFPKARYVSDLFPADIMKNDTYVVPTILGVCYFPLRWIGYHQSASYLAADQFTVLGDQTALFSPGQYLLAICGVDGVKRCFVVSNTTLGGGAMTLVVLTTASDDLTSNLTAVVTDHYVLGPSSFTFTITKAKAPNDTPGGKEYSSSSYTFKQDTITGNDSNTYKAVQLLGADNDNDDSNDSNAIFGPFGQDHYDVPFQISESTLSTKTNPADQVEWFLEQFGVASAQIDDTAKDAIADIFDARTFSANIPIWYTIPRKKLLCKLLTLGDMYIIPRDKIYLKLFSKTSQATLGKDDIIDSTFKINPLYTKESMDSGYVVWQKSTMPLGQEYENKNLVSAKSGTLNPSDTVIEAEWLSDDTGVKQQKAAVLAIQKILLKDKTISFSTKLTKLALEPGDMITLSELDYGAESASYKVMIEEMHIYHDGHIDFICTKFSADLDDWGDLSKSSITVNTTYTDKAYSPVYQGPRDAVAGTNKANEITQTINIKSNGNIIVENGADIELRGSGSDPGVIKFYGTSYDSEIGGNADGTKFTIRPMTHDATKFYLGYSIAWWGTTDTRFQTIQMESVDDIYLFAGESAGAHNGALISMDGNDDNSQPSIQVRLHDKTSETSSYFYFLPSTFLPGDHKTLDIGSAVYAFDDIYADDFQNVADFPLLDQIINKDGKKIPIDDLVILISSFCGSGKFDKRTGLEIINDDKLPEWLLTKNKKTGAILKSKDGKPYLSLKLLLALLIGAIKQLALKNKENS